MFAAVGFSGPRSDHLCGSISRFIFSCNIYVLGLLFLLSLSVSWSHYWKRPFRTPPRHQSPVIVIVLNRNKNNIHFAIFIVDLLIVNLFTQTRLSLHNDPWGRGLGAWGVPGGGAWDCLGLPGVPPFVRKIRSLKLERLKVWKIRMWTLNVWKGSNAWKTERLKLLNVWGFVTSMDSSCGMFDCSDVLPNDVQTLCFQMFNLLIFLQVASLRPLDVAPRASQRPWRLAMGRLVLWESCR